jgi:hypothetical protein
VVWDGLAKQAFAVGPGARFAVSNPARECRVASGRSKKPDEASSNDDDRKREGEEKDGHECSRCQSLQRSALEGTSADSDHGFNHHRRNSRLQTKESRGHIADLAHSA